MKICLDNIIFREVNKSELFGLASLLNFKQVPIVLTENKILYLAILKFKNGAEKIVGFFELSIFFESCDIVDFEVSKNYRGKGIGKLFLSKLIVYLKNKNIEKVFLEVRISNFVAIKLYKNLGFSEIDLRKDYYTNPFEDAIVMCKYIKN